MPSPAEKALAALQKMIGVEQPPSDWHSIDQKTINAFADITLDHQYIHVDPERAAHTPYGSTIAHGFLTLSLITHLTQGAKIADPNPLDTAVFAINYGLDRVRFPSALKPDSRIRARKTLLSAELKDPVTIQFVLNVLLEVEGEDKPACVAEWVCRAIFPPA